MYKDCHLFGLYVNIHKEQREQIRTKKYKIIMQRLSKLELLENAIDNKYF